MPDTVYYNLQRASRTHRQLTWQETRVKNIITMLIDKTFTGLWNPDNAIFSDKWGKASLLFVSQYPTPQQAIKMGARRLSELGSRGFPLRTANRFIKLAYSMMKNETLYCPKTGNPLTTLDEYYQSAWSKVKEKLTDYLSDDIPQDNYLVKIQHQLGEKYGIT